MTQAEKKNNPDHRNDRQNDPKPGGQRDPGNGEPSADEKNNDGRRNGSESGRESGGSKDGKKE